MCSFIDLNDELGYFISGIHFQHAFLEPIRKNTEYSFTPVFSFVGVNLRLVNRIKSWTLASLLNHPIFACCTPSTSLDNSHRALYHLSIRRKHSLCQMEMLPPTKLLIRWPECPCKFARQCATPYQLLQNNSSLSYVRL